jgi:serine/threonine protein kinase/uncharacterized protein HemY
MSADLTERDPFDVVADSFLARCRAGELPTVADYVARHPDFADRIHELFPALVIANQWPSPSPNGHHRLGEYRIVREVGHGGMGVVYEAIQESLGRRVALKVLPWQGSANPARLERFRRESRTAAKLHHTNIVPVFGVGEHEGVHFFAMQFIDGAGLDAVLPELRRLAHLSGGGPGEGPGAAIAQALLAGHFVPPGEEAPAGAVPAAGGPYWRSVATIGVQVAEALTYAHGQGVLHRDVKPANLLLDTRGIVWVNDFGLAYLSDSQVKGEPDLTSTGDVIGTLRYLPPERFQSRGDGRSDLYSLGLTLYELLTLKPAFDETDRHRLIRQLTQEEPSRPRQINPAIPCDLETIILKAIAREPARRYPTAAAFAEDLRRFLDGRSVLARRTGPARRLGRWCRRNPLVAGLLTALAVVLAGGLATVSWKWIEAEGWREEERVARADAVEARLQAEERAREVREGLERLKAANALLERGRFYAAAHRWNDAHDAFTTGLRLRPDHVTLRVERGELFARLGLWDLAAEDFARAFAVREPDFTLRWYRHALLRLQVGDLAGYRQVRRQMGGRFRGTIDGSLAIETVRTHILTPDPGGDLTPLVEEDREMVKYQGERDWYTLYVLGAAHYRAGEFPEAVRRLRGSLAATSNCPPRALTYPVLAMAYHRLNQPAEARQALAEAGRAIDQWTRDRYQARDKHWVTHLGAEASWPIPWWDWLECRLLYREARMLIDGAPPPDDPRLGVLRARAFAGLRQHDRADAAYTAALVLLPNDRQVRMEAHRNRGYLHARRRQWAEAAEEFGRACALQPDDVYLWRFLAVTRLGAGQVDAYRRACGEMMKRFGKTEDLRTAWNVVYACTLREDAVPDKAALLRLAGFASRQWHAGAWTQGAALYRAGKYAEAARAFEASAKVFRPRAWDWAFRAMAHHRLGEGEEAKRCLAEAVRWVEEAERHKGDDLSGTRPAWIGWDERIVYPLLVREAEALLRGKEQVSTGKRPKGRGQGARPASFVRSAGPGACP